VALEDHERANACYFDECFRILGLASRAYDLWLTQEQGERGKLLNLLLPNCSFHGESLRATYRKPFCWIAEGHQCSDWLPGPDDCRNWVEEHAFPLTQGLQRDMEGNPVALPPLPKSAITLAIEYRDMLDRGVVDTQAELADRAGVTPARVSQLLKLFTLPEPILAYLRDLSEAERKRFSERHLRPIAGNSQHEVQLAMFEGLRRQPHPVARIPEP